MFITVKIRLFLVPQIFDPLKNSQDPPGEFWTIVRGHTLGWRAFIWHLICQDRLDRSLTTSAYSF